MFISQLKSKINTYDRYGEHRTNGLKAVFVLELLFLFNYIYTVPNPYFYYFYIPLTAFMAELAGNTLAEKYLLYFYTMAGTILAVFCFGLFSTYKIFFVFFTFFYALLIYFTASYKFKTMLIPAPIILSLAVYSLIYDNTNSNFYIALNHALQTLVAMLVIFAGLFVFPKKYYFSIWRRAFYDVLITLENLSGKICRGEISQMPIVGGTIIMERYSKLLSPRIKFFSVLKITLLTLELTMAMSYLVAFQKQIRIEYVNILHRYLGILAMACAKQQAVTIIDTELPIFSTTYELKTLHQLLLSWNYLCQK